MDIKKLFSGIAIIIDDNIKKEHSRDPILEIRDQLKNNNHISILEYEDLPDDSEIPNFKNISFVLLDWYLFETPEPGMLIDEQLFINNNIKFLKKIKEIAFIPVFIFSNQDPNSIIDELSEAAIYDRDSNNNYIFVKRKKDLLSNDNTIFTEIEKWLKLTPSMYVLKEWECSLSEAKRKLFWDFYEINPNWPSVLQKTFTEDGSDVNYELGNFIYKNLSARAEQIAFKDDILNQEVDSILLEDIRKVLEAERFLKNDSLPQDKPCTGDLFEYECDGNGAIKKGYYLNIRPECDIAIRPGVTSNPQLYCLKGHFIDEERINSKEDDEIIFRKGNFIEKSNNTYVPFIVDGKIIEFFFSEIKVKTWNSIKSTRIGRLLPPYITKVQQRYSSYLQRQGLPAIPEKAIK